MGRATFLKGRAKTEKEGCLFLEKVINCMRNKRVSCEKEKEKNMQHNKKTIPVFYAVDKNYLPFLAVAVASIKKYAKEENEYVIHVLYTGDLGERLNDLLAMQTDNLRFEFTNVSKEIAEIESMLHCRDYYTNAIYYRLFIPDLFPQYDKAIYLDSDTVLLADIAELYNEDLGENLIGAVNDEAVINVPAFCEYTQKALDIPPETYFNSGVILLNTKKMREMDFCKVFREVLSSYDFVVAPDQDCLNLICKGRIKYFGVEWNKLPIGGELENLPKLIHYNLTMKPWHYDGILYSEYFWDYAKQTPFYEDILTIKKAFTPEMAKRDEEGGKALLQLAQAEADSPNNYINTVVKKR